MSDDQKADDSDSWTSMWQSPAITTFGGTFPENYDSEILDFWKQQLTGGRYRLVVDLACGNGALTWICNDILNAETRNTSIIGIDAAKIDPFKALEREASDYPAIRFVGETRIESLPFEDASVVLIVSQFGIEYSDLEKTVREIGRIISPGGKLVLILHNTNSTVVKASAEYLDSFTKLSSQLQLHDLALELIGLYEKHGISQQLKESPEYREIWTKITPIVQANRPLMKNLPDKSPLMAHTRALNKATDLNSRAPISARRKMLDQQYCFLIASMKRLEELVAAALSDEELGRLTELLESAGMHVTTTGTLQYKVESNFGTTLSAERT